MYEKHVLDHLYRIISKRYNITHTFDRVDELVPLDHDYIRINLSQVDIDNHYIILPTSDIPYNNEDVYLVQNGRRQEYLKDYSIFIDRPNEQDQEITTVYIKWNHDNYQVNDEIYILWSFLNPQSLSAQLNNLNDELFE
jgi:hypothetical protein